MRKSTSSPHYAELRRRLAFIRNRANLSQRALGERLGVPHTWVAKVESGERRIDLLEFGWYCEACGVRPVGEAKAILEAVSGNGSEVAA